MDVLETLFKFPILMVDGTMEERKNMLNLPSDDGELDLVQGFAECPYYDFVSIADRWLPTPVLNPILHHHLVG